MGHRLSKIYTRTGDDGSTGLGDGTRTAKDSARVNAYGTVDEANSTIGLLLAADLPDDIRELLTAIAVPGYPACNAGLAACYVAGIPFFQWTVLGTLFYAALLFGGFELLRKRMPALQAQTA